MCLPLTPVKQRSDHVYLIDSPVVEHDDVSLWGQKLSLPHFFPSELRAQVWGRDPGAKVKGTDVSQSSNRGDTKPGRREENVGSGEVGQW